MKNNLTDSIYKAWRTGILPLVTALLLLTGCEMDSDMDLPLNVDSNKYTLTSDAGSTQVRIYSTGEWSVRLSEDVEWASINRLNGSGNTPVLFKYGANYGVPRAVDITRTGGTHDAGGRRPHPVVGGEPHRDFQQPLGPPHRA